MALLNVSTTFSTVPWEFTAKIINTVGKNSYSLPSMCKISISGASDFTPFFLVFGTSTCVDLLHLHKVDTGEILPRPVNIEKVVVVPEFFSTNLRPHDEILVEPDMDPNAEPGHAIPNSDLVSVAFEFGKYLKTLPNNLLCLHKHVTFLWVSPLHSRNTRMPWPSYRSC